MTDAFREHRRPLARGGFKRVEPAVASSSADLLRRIVQDLAQNDARVARMRAVLRWQNPSLRRRSRHGWPCCWPTGPSGTLSYSCSGRTAPI
jgi:hypothetical protein